MGIIDRAVEQLVSQAKPSEAHIDSASCKVHKYANSQTESSENQCVEKSKGRRNTKIHGLVDEQNRPLKVFLSPGNDHDSKHALELIREIQDAIIAADKAYDTNAIRAGIESGGNTATKSKPSSSASKSTKPSPHDMRNFRQAFLGLVTLSAIIDWLR